MDAWKLLAIAAALTIAGTAGVSARPRPIVIERQGSFFVGGREVRADELTTLPGLSREGTVSVDQAYVQYQIPPGANRRPNLVFLHGCCLTGAVWESTPDERMGWQEFFLRAGFATYVVDAPWRGRSAVDTTAVNLVHAGKLPLATLPGVQFVPREVAWQFFRFGPRYGETYPGLQFPIGAAAQFWKQMVPDWTYARADLPSVTITSIAQLAGKLGRAVIVSHSQSGPYAFAAARAAPHAVAGLVQIEPDTCPPASTAKAFGSTAILIVYGDFIRESDQARSSLQSCQTFAAAGRETGGNIKVIELPQLGLRGNSHMLMLDRNNLAIADLIRRWISKNARDPS